MKNIITVIIAVMLFSSCSSPYIHVMDLETGHTYTVRDTHSLTKVKDTLVTVRDIKGRSNYYGKFLSSLPSDKRSIDLLIKYNKVIRIK